MKESKNSKKLMRVITAPIRALRKARDVYVKGMNTYAGRGFYCGATMGFSAVEPLPLNFTARSTHGAGSDDLTDLIRAHAHKLDLGELNQPGRRHNHENQQRAINHSGYMNGRGQEVPRSASVGMAKIDEDMACEFGIDDFGEIARSRSYAV